MPSMPPTMPSLTLLLLLLLSLLPRLHSQLLFSDVTTQVGITQKNGTFKWGGPCIADLDNDGNYDLILSFHASAPVQIYWGTSTAFEKDPFRFQADVHGINVAPRSARTQERLLAINVGGGRGNALKPPLMHVVDSSRRIREATAELGFADARGRGRVTMFMDLALGSVFNRRRASGGPDALVVGYAGGRDEIPQQAYENRRGQFVKTPPHGFINETEARAAVIDIDGDGIMEVISFPNPQIYKLQSAFNFSDITTSVLGDKKSPYKAKTLAAVAEFDMNNRGNFDIYFARSLVEDLLPTSKPGLPFDDVLFKNNGRRLVDISGRAGIPKNTRSMGVTTGDFDNDGYVDLFVTVASGRDFFLMNNGNDTFSQVFDVIPKEEGIPGGHAVAVDYDKDGRLDLIVGQGQKDGIRGVYRVMKNVLPRNDRHYLLVRVGHHPAGIVTALHAIVTVRVGGMRMIRRVGGVGTQAGGPSFVDTVHFGLGEFDVVDSVSVKWVAGRARRLRRVGADRLVTLGRVN